jgi:hypothetical protein
MPVGVPVGRKKKHEPRPTGPRTIGIRSSAEWADWLDELARHYRTTVAGVIDRALTEWTESEGYPKRPPERTP